MGTGKYILDGHTPVLIGRDVAYLDPADIGTPEWHEELLIWGRFMENHQARRVDKDCIGDVEVSTVFLGLDHQYGSGPPILFETMVFGGPLDGEQERCSTWEEAEAMHAAMVERVKAAGPGSPVAQIMDDLKSGGIIT